MDSVKIIKVNDDSVKKGVKAKKNTTKYMKYFAVVLLLVAVVGVAKAISTSNDKDLSLQNLGMEESNFRALGTCPYWKAQQEKLAAANAGSTCVNKKTSCDSWKANGYCTNQYKSYMQTNCAKACGHCTEQSNSNSNNQQSNNNNQQSNNNGASCVNKNGNCDAWKNAGECNRNPAYMNTNCAKACGKCSSSSSNNNNQQSNNNNNQQSNNNNQQSNSNSASCTDKRGSSCNSWKSSGYCTNQYKAFMEENCAKACGKCGGSSNNQQNNNNNQQNNNNNQQNNNNNQQNSNDPDPQDFKDKILKETNIRRCMHGAPALVWNDPLYQNTAQTFGQQTQMKHSKSYDLTSAQGGPAGENLYMAGWKANPESAVTAWYNEVKDCLNWPGCTQTSGEVGHFTALVWKGTTVMACARSQAKPGLIACRYGNGPGSGKTSNTPNMGGSHSRMVFKATRTYSQCAAQF